MYYLPDVRKKRVPLGGSEIAHEMQLFQDAKDADFHNRIRAVENLQLYAPTDNINVWAADLASTFLREKRTPNHYNFMQLYVEGIGGNLVTNRVDPRFVDNSADKVDVSRTLEKLHKIYYADKDHFAYNWHHLNAIVNGLIYRGVEEIQIARTLDDPMGRICFKSHNPIAVVFDNGNFEDDIARYSRHAWKRFYLTPRQMAEVFEERNREIAEKLSSLDKDGVNDQPNIYGYPTTEMWGKKYEVVEHYHFKKEKKMIAIDCGCGVLLPETPYDFGSEDDYYAKKSWAMQQGYDLQPENIQVVQRKLDVLHCTTFCPSLGFEFENRADERQLIDNKGGGLLPFFTWSYVTKGGNSFGVVDFGKVMQEDINKREAHKSKMFTQTPIGGKSWVHPLAFGEDQKKKQAFLEDLNDPSKAVVFDAEAPPGMQLFGVAAGSQVNPAIFSDESQKIQFMQQILRLPSAMQGQVGRSGESGVLFGRKVIEGNMMQKVPMEALEMYQEQKFSAWLQLAIQVYGGRNKDERMANLDRQFSDREGHSISINTFLGYDEYSTPIVEDDISQLRNVNVIISKAKDNDYMRQAKRETDIAYLSAMQPSETNAGFRAIAEMDLAANLDGITEDQRDQIKEMGAQVLNLTRKQLMLAEVTIDSQLQQAMGMQQQMQAPAPQGQIPALPQAGPSADMQQLQNVQAAAPAERETPKRFDTGEVQPLPTP